MRYVGVTELNPSVAAYLRRVHSEGLSKRCPFVGAYSERRIGCDTSDRVRIRWATVPFL